MVKYLSQYPKLSFYVDNKIKYFINGVYVTEDEKEIKVLDSLKSCKRVQEEQEPKAEESKRDAKKKPSAK